MSEPEIKPRIDGNGVGWCSFEECPLYMCGSGPVMRPLCSINGMVVHPLMPCPHHTARMAALLRRMLNRWEGGVSTTDDLVGFGYWFSYGLAELRALLGEEG